MLNANGLPQRALVIGGGSDLARAIVRELAVSGPLERVALLGPRRSSLERVAAELAAHLDACATFELDLRAATSSIADALAPALEWLGGLDSVLMAAGTLPDQEVADHDPRVVEEAFQVNGTGPAVALTVLADHLERAGAGQLIVLSSVAATVVRRRSYLYDASKAALDRFALGLADRLEPAIGVHIVRPIFVATRMTEGRPRPAVSLSAEQVARATVAGLQARRRIIWVPPLARPAIAAISVLPRRLVRRLPL